MDSLALTYMPYADRLLYRPCVDIIKSMQDSPANILA